jgi:hypothetical protein
MFREVPLLYVGVVALEFGEEFIGTREASIRLADARDSVNDELAEAIISDEVKEASGELVKDGAFVIFD